MHGGAVEGVIAEVIAEKGAWVIEVETTPERVHPVVEVDRQFGIHRLVKATKVTRRGAARPEFEWLWSRLPTLWANSYFVAPVAGRRCL
jgi:putative transposase